jgi:hypothetical protein
VVAEESHGAELEAAYDPSAMGEQLHHLDDGTPVPREPSLHELVALLPHLSEEEVRVFLKVVLALLKG